MIDRILITQEGNSVPCAAYSVHEIEIPLGTFGDVRISYDDDAGELRVIRHRSGTSVECIYSEIVEMPLRERPSKVRR